MELIVKFDGWNDIFWDGAGTYVAKTLRGPITFRKLPFGMKPLNSNVTVRDFATKPVINSLVLLETKNTLWEPA